jgi:fatty acid desaturase
MCLPPAPAPASAAAKGRATYDAATSPTGYRRRQTSATPSVKAINAAIPPRCFVRDTRRSLGYALCSVVMTLSLGAAAYLTIPLRLAYAPLWALYAFANGTVATGCWVVAHECGHGAFSDHSVLQDLVGYVLHSLLLVPYFSWQRSHAVHHSRTNHLTEGETHCPPVRGKTLGGALVAAHRFVAGELGVGVYQLVTHLLLGWPLYLLAGATGGPSRGITNHFLPWSESLFPGYKWKLKVLLSDVGVAGTLFALYAWSQREGSSPALVLALYGGPYLGVNLWLVLYTWLQHTDVDVPHLDASEWTWTKGAFLTVDRPYGALLDFLHHNIGSTHAAHHLCSRVPHYHAKEATEAIRKAFPEHYLYDPTPITRALWRVASKCAEVEKTTGADENGKPTTLWMFDASDREAKKTK